MIQQGTGWNLHHGVGATLLENWVEERAVGDIILDERSDIKKLSRHGHHVREQIVFSQTYHLINYIVIHVLFRKIEYFNAFENRTLNAIKSSRSLFIYIT